MPPTTVVQTFPDRVQLEFTRPDETVRIPATAANGFAIAQGDVIGAITSGGKVRRRSRTAAGTGGVSAASPTFNVVDASVFAVDDVLVNEEGATIGTVLSLDTVDTPNTVTLDANAAINLAASDGVMASDGSQVAQGISDDAVDGTGDTTIAVTITGILDVAKLRGLDASAMEELAGATLLGVVFKF
jgi:hypothetical protein